MGKVPRSWVPLPRARLFPEVTEVMIESNFVLAKLTIYEKGPPRLPLLLFIQIQQPP